MLIKHWESIWKAINHQRSRSIKTHTTAPCVHSLFFFQTLLQVWIVKRKGTPLRLPFTTLIRHILDRERPYYWEWCPKTWLDHNDLRFYISREANTERKSSLAASFLCGAFKCSLTVALRSSPSWLDKAGRATAKCLARAVYKSLNVLLIQ